MVLPKQIITSRLQLLILIFRSLSVHGELGFRMFQICPINKFVSSYLFAEYQDASHPIKSISSCANHNIIAYVKESSPRVVRVS